MADADEYYRAAADVLHTQRTAPELLAFAAATGDGRLRLQRCVRCSAARFPASAVCPECWSAEAEWRLDDGDASIWSFCVYHHAFIPEFRTIVPYAVCVVELDSGPRFVTNPVDVGPTELRIGMRGRVVAVPVGEAGALPYFFTGRRS